MNRIIKFRAWDKKRKRMLDVVKLGFRLDYREEIDGPISGVTVMGDGHEDLLNFELMQFTGLKDENGKEIYEGDLMTLKRPDREWDYKYLKVCWNKSMFELQSKDGKYIMPIYPAGNYIVIGNIYEDKDLLK